MSRSSLGEIVKLKTLIDETNCSHKLSRMVIVLLDTRMKTAVWLLEFINFVFLIVLVYPFSSHKFLSHFTPLKI